MKICRKLHILSITYNWVCIWISISLVQSVFIQATLDVVINRGQSCRGAMGLLVFTKVSQGKTVVKADFNKLTYFQMLGIF